MRRLAATGLLAALALALVALLGGGERAHGSSDYRVDGIFSTAKGVIPGQLVKIAGARVGTVKDVVLTPDFHARIEMEVDSRFAPFRGDAHCEIRPEALIAENFVQCDPGTTARPPLAAKGGHAPTVPIKQTAEPVSLTDLFQIFNTPVRDRFRVLANELGIGFAARGQDINELLHRANPTLALARRAIRLLNRQRTQIVGIVDNSERLIGELARRRQLVNGFVDRAARVATRFADHRAELAAGIHGLPPLLAAARPALHRIDVLTAAGTPILRNLRVAAPSLDRLTGDLRPFLVAGGPALRALGDVAGPGIRTAHGVGPLITQLDRATRKLLELSPATDALLTNLRQRGGVENLLAFVYGATAAAARYDATSHFIPAHVLSNIQCSQPATTPVAGCSANFHSAGAAASAAPASTARTGHPAPTPAPTAAPASSTPTSTPAAPAPATDGRLPLDVRRIIGGLTDVQGTADSTVQALTDYLLH